jgi:hypothetical protein
MLESLGLSLIGDGDLIEVPKIFATENLDLSEASPIESLSCAEGSYLESLRRRILFASPSKECAKEDARTEGCNI